MKFLFSFLSIFLIPIFCYAQITIEERVEIEPQSIIFPNNPTQNYTFRVEVDWDAEEVQANNHFWNANLQVNTVLKNSCDQIAGETGFVYGWPTGSNTLEVSANAYSYQILVTLSGFYDSYQFVDLTVRTYLNSEQLDTYTQRVNSGIWPNYSDTVTTNFYQFVYLVEEFNFNVDDDQMEYGCFYTVDLRTNPGGNCSSSVVASLVNDPVNLTILTGEEYLAFYDNGIGEIVGSSTQITENNIWIIDLVYQNPLRDTVSKIAVIQLESNGIVETDSIEILPAPDDLNVTIFPDTIKTGEQAEIDIFLDYCPPFETQINIEIIKGQEYGSLIDPLTNERTKVLTNLVHWFGSVFVDYEADGISSEVKDTVIIMVSTTDPEITPKEVTLYIKPPPIFVYTVPDVVGADDTADVIIKKRNADGTLEDFPPEQIFELAVLDGCVNGNFMVDDSIKVYFADALQPIKFVTADSLDSEFGEVLIRVGTDLSGYMRPIGNIKREEKALTEKRKGLDTLRVGFEKMIAEKKVERLAEKDKNNITPPTEAPIIAACYNGSYLYGENYWKGDINTRSQFELVIAYPNSESPDEKITGEPKMPTVICKAILKNYNNGEVKYEWKYWVNFEFARQYFSKSQNKYISLCSREGQVRFIGTSYSINSDTTYWTVSFKNDDVKSFKFVARQPEIPVWPSYGGNCEDTLTTWDEGENIFIGGNVIVEVTAKDQFENIISSASTISNRILGDNPEPEDVYTYANSKEIEAILRHESRTKHFETNNRRYPMYEAGWPIYGYPNGYGLMQIDNPPATEKQIWNWQSNLDAGSDLYFNDMKPRVQEYLDDHKPYEDEILLKCTFQRYNYRKEYLYIWNEETEEWEINENVPNAPGKNKRYYEFVWDIYQGL